MVGPRRLKYRSAEPRRQAARWVSGEALMTHNDAAGGTLVRWPGVATNLANRQGVAMAVPSWRLMGAHGLSVSFTVYGRCKPFAVSAFLLSEAQLEVDS